MKTLNYVLDNYKSQTIDGRDIHRLMKFIPENKLNNFKIELKDEYKGTHKHIQLTKRNILRQLKKDVAFGFEKALGQCGISSSLMFQVVKMWNWILEDGLENWSDNDYEMYGLPLFKATALKYNFNIPIGD